MIQRQDVIDILKVMGRELTTQEIDKVVAEHDATYKKVKEGTWDDVVLEQADKIITERI